MRVLVSTLVHSPSALHGGAIIASRHARALARHGLQVLVAAPGAEGVSDAYAVEGYGQRAHGLFLDRRPDPGARLALDGVIGRYCPDILYDVHGPIWAVDAAVAARVPVVSMVGDYSWFCLRSVLVDDLARRCSGPDSVEKCFGCINGAYSTARRVVHVALRHARDLDLGGPSRLDSRISSLFLWQSLVESEGYLSELRARVDRFVIGDRMAREFMLGHGIAPAKLVGIGQCLPDAALRVRRKHSSDEVAGRTRPLRIAFVGRPHPEKGLQVLARAFEWLPQDAPLELWIVHGKFATPSVLRKLFDDVALFYRNISRGRIRLFRPADSESVFDLMSEADLGVIPSLAYESPSLVMLEFVAQRTPIVRSESAGMEHVIQDGINGRTFPYGDWAALARIIEEVLADPSLLDRWRARLPMIDSDATYAQRLAGLFEELVATRKAMPA